MKKQRGEELALGYIISSDNPFDAFSNPFLRDLPNRLNADRFSSLALSRSSMRRLLERTFPTRKALIRDEPAASLTQIHLAFNLWTSSNGLAIPEGCLATLSAPRDNRSNASSPRISSRAATAAKLSG